MEYKRGITAFLGICLMASVALTPYGQSKTEERVFQEAKILLFDKEWEEAQEKLEDLIEDFPESPLYAQALFYIGKCLEEQRGKEREAIETYERFTIRDDRNESLAEEAEISIIALAFRLYEKGKKSYLDEIEKRMHRTNRTVSYYAAFQMSYVKDKKEARKAIPVLKEILSRERSEELRDRARIALLRVDPKTLEDFEEQRYERKARILHIRVENRWKKEPVFSINIPWALADLALSAIPEENKRELEVEGYDIDEIIEEITEFRGRIVEIKTESSIFKIWID